VLRESIEKELHELLSSTLTNSAFGFSHRINDIADWLRGSPPGIIHAPVFPSATIFCPTIRRKGCLPPWVIVAFDGDTRPVISVQVGSLTGSIVVLQNVFLRLHLANKRDSLLCHLPVLNCHLCCTFMVRHLGFALRSLHNFCPFTGF